MFVAVMAFVSPHLLQTVSTKFTTAVIHLRHLFYRLQVPNRQPSPEAQNSRMSSWSAGRTHDRNKRIYLHLQQFTRCRTNNLIVINCRSTPDNLSFCPLSCYVVNACCLMKRNMPYNYSILRSKTLMSILQLLLKPG